MRFKDYFSKDFESTENNYYPTLRTRYYRARINEAKDALLEVIEEEKGNIIDDNETYMETLFECPEYSCTARLIATSPVEIAVDFKVTTFSFFGFGKGKKVIEKLYQKMDNKLQFKGVGLYKG